MLAPRERGRPGAGLGCSSAARQAGSGKGRSRGRALASAGSWEAQSWAAGAGALGKAASGELRAKPGAPVEEGPVGPEAQIWSLGQGRRDGRGGASEETTCPRPGKGACWCQGPTRTGLDCRADPEERGLESKQQARTRGQEQSMGSGWQWVAVSLPGWGSRTVASGDQQKLARNTGHPLVGPGTHRGSGPWRALIQAVTQL